MWSFVWNCCQNILSKYCPTVCKPCAVKYAEHRAREQALLVVVFSVHQEVGESRCPSAPWAAKWVRSGAAADTRAQMVWQKMCRKPLFAWVSRREGLPSLPACRDTRSTSQSGGSRAMCYRPGCTVHPHPRSHKHKHTCICRNVQIQAAPSSTAIRKHSCTCTCYSEWSIKAFIWKGSRIFKLSIDNLKDIYL